MIILVVRPRSWKELGSWSFCGVLFNIFFTNQVGIIAGGLLVPEIYHKLGSSFGFRMNSTKNREKYCLGCHPGQQGPRQVLRLSLCHLVKNALVETSQFLLKIRYPVQNIL